MNDHDADAPGAFFDRINEFFIWFALPELLLAAGVTAGNASAVDVLFVAATLILELNLALFFHFILPNACEPLKARMVSLGLAIYMVVMNVTFLLDGLRPYRFIWIFFLLVLVAYKDRELAIRFRSAPFAREMETWYANVKWTLGSTLLGAIYFYFLMHPLRRIELLQFLIEADGIRLRDTYDVYVPASFYVLYLFTAIRSFWRNARTFYGSGREWAKSLREYCAGNAGQTA